MEIKYGVISADSHAQLGPDAFVARMSRARFGDRIPHLRETVAPRTRLANASDRVVERWFVNGKLAEPRGVSNCPAMMEDPSRTYFPQRWEEVPDGVYKPLARLHELDRDGIDAEVLFPNPPVQEGVFFQGDAEFELACVQAYNDALMEEWRGASDRYVPLALIPYLGGIEQTVAEVGRAAQIGYRGIVMVAEPASAVRGSGAWALAADNPGYRLKHFADPYWNPLWEACQDLDLTIHWHANAGLRVMAPIWKGYAPDQVWASVVPAAFSALSQFIPLLVFSGILDRYPRLRWASAETGVGWLNYVLDACDHEWERRRLWSEGIAMRPSERLQRQFYVMSWFETEGIKGCRLAAENIMWESDFPHNPSTYPHSHQVIDRMLEGMPEERRRRILWENAARLYKML